MLSREEQAEIETELQHYEQPQAATIEALKIVQRHRGWVSDEAVIDLAEVLHSSTAAIDSVATFYNLIYRQPVGRHVIHLCDSVSCWIMGQDRVRRLLQQRLGIHMGQTSADQRFTLLPTVCLGTCDHAPAMLIGRDTHRDLESLDPQRLDKLLEQYP